VYQVADGESSPALQRLALRTALRAHRNGTGMSGEQVTAAVLDAFADSFSTAKLSRIESGAQVPLPRDVSELAHVYHLPKQERDRLVELAKSARKPSRYQGYSAIEDKYRTFAEFESAATGLRTYESTFIPGLFQTRAYTEAVIRGLNPAYTDDHIRELVEVRMNRQARLSAEDPLRVHAFVQENAIRRTVGDADIVLDQISRLKEVAALDHVTLQIIPYNAGMYQALQASAFVLLDIADEQVTPICYLEGILWNLFADDRTEKAKITAAWDELLSRPLAHPAADTPRLLDAIADRVAAHRERK
jgi:hypothetical protein